MAAGRGDSRAVFGAGDPNVPPIRVHPMQR
jgi:hypothetical protein